MNIDPPPYSPTQLLDIWSISLNFLYLVHSKVFITVIISFVVLPEFMVVTIFLSH